MEFVGQEQDHVRVGFLDIGMQRVKRLLGVCAVVSVISGMKMRGQTEDARAIRVGGVNNGKHLFWGTRAVVHAEQRMTMDVGEMHDSPTFLHYETHAP